MINGTTNNPPCPECSGFAAWWSWGESSPDADVWACACGASFRVPVAGMTHRRPVGRVS